MASWIALLRGINVGGRNLLPMAQLRSGLEEIGCKNVRTYIQSGNVVLDSSARSAKSVAKKLVDHIESQHGFRPPVVVFKLEQLQAALAENPFPEAAADPKTLHFFFLDAPPKKPDTDGIEAARAATESWQLIDSVFYLHAPDGMAKSKLGAKAEKLLGVTATARNLRTVQKILELAK